MATSKGLVTRTHHIYGSVSCRLSQALSCPCLLQNYFSNRKDLASSALPTKHGFRLPAPRMSLGLQTQAMFERPLLIWSTLPSSSYTVRLVTCKPTGDAAPGATVTAQWVRCCLSTDETLGWIPPYHRKQVFAGRQTSGVMAVL